MFDRVKAFLKKYLFAEGLIVGFLLCHAMYSQFLVGRMKEGHSAEIKVSQAELRSKDQIVGQLQQELKRRDDYEKKFQAEAIARAVAERKLAELQTDYQTLEGRHQNLLNLKWEEKYNTEKLARISEQEQSALLNKRLADATDRVPKADPFLVKQLEALNEQNRILTTERDELRKLYTSSTNAVASTVPISPRQTSAKSVGKALLASLSGVAILDVADTIIKGVKSWGGPLDGQTFILMLNEAAILDRTRVVKACAPYLARPLTETEIQSISSLMSVLEAGDAMSVLMKEQMKK